MQQRFTRLAAIVAAGACVAATSLLAQQAQTPIALAGHHSVRRGRSNGDAAERRQGLHSPQRAAGQARRVAAGGQGGIDRRGRRSAGAGPSHRAHGVQRQRAFQAGRAGLDLRIDRRAARTARERLHELRRDRVHARPADRQARHRDEGVDGDGRFRRRADARSGRESTRNAASSSRNGAAVWAPARASATSSSRCCSIARGTPSGCRSASRRSSATRRRRGCARSTTPGIGPSTWRSSSSATSMRSAIEQERPDAFGPLTDARARGARTGSDRAAPLGAAGQRRHRSGS